MENITLILVFIIIILIMRLVRLKKMAKVIALANKEYSREVSMHLKKIKQLTEDLSGLEIKYSVLFHHLRVLKNKIK